MPFVTRKSLLTLGILSGVAVAAAAGFIWSGVYNVGADDQHTRPVHALMQALRDRSIETRANRLTRPALNDPARITQGSGNYNAMCMACHLAPGMAPTELSRGLYPAPPELAKQTVDAAKAFWVIKHGIKASGMPAWGKSMEDAYIWNMVAFLQKLPTLTPAQYEAMVASSGGHSHGGGETQPHAHGGGVADDHHAMPASQAADESKPHAHAPGTPAHEDKATGTAVEARKPHAHPPVTPPDHHKPAAAPTDPKPTPTMVEHQHADGTVESHPAPQPTKADDGHDHQH